MASIARPLKIELLEKRAECFIVDWMSHFIIVGGKRTWSHSAVEFMKYRRRLPAILGPEQSSTDNGDSICGTPVELSSVPFHQTAARANKVTYLPVVRSNWKVRVFNVSALVSASQLCSFMCKFGPVAKCSLDMEGRNHTVSLTQPYATMRRGRRHKGSALVTFRDAQSAQKCLNATQPELRLYDMVMIVARITRSPDSSGRANFPDDISVCSSTDYYVEEPLESDTENSGGNFLRCPSSLSGHSGAAQPLAGVLDTQVLKAVFGWLSMAELVRVERVCKKWMEAAYLVWSTSSSFRPTPHSLGCIGDDRLRQCWLTALLHRVGSSVHTVDLSAAPQPLHGPNVIASVAGTCVRLKKLNVCGVRSVSWTAMQQLSELRGHSLSHFAADRHCHLTEKALWHLFRGCRNLRQVDLSGCNRIKGTSFRLLGLLLEKVYLSDCINLEPACIREICMKSPNVSALHLDRCAKLDDEAFNLIGRSLRSLHSFSMCGDNLQVSEHGLMQLRHLTNLQQLYLRDVPSLTDNVMEMLCDNVSSLEEVSVCGAGSEPNQLTANTIDALCLLPKLRVVDMSHQRLLSDCALVRLCAARHASLTHLVAHGCPKVTGKCLIDLARVAEVGRRLELLDLSACVQVSYENVESMCKTVAQRKSFYEHAHPPLTIVLGGTGVCPTSVDKLQRLCAPLVQLDGADRSECRQMFGNTGVDSVSIGQLDLASQSDEERETSDDEFECLSAQRSFIVDSLEQDEFLPEDDGEQLRGDPFAHFDLQMAQKTVTFSLRLYEQRLLAEQLDSFSGLVVYHSHEEDPLSDKFDKSRDKTPRCLGIVQLYCRSAVNGYVYFDSDTLVDGRRLLRNGSGNCCPVVGLEVTAVVDRSKLHSGAHVYCYGLVLSDTRVELVDLRCTQHGFTNGESASATPEPVGIAVSANGDNGAGTSAGVCATIVYTGHALGHDEFASQVRRREVRSKRCRASYLLQPGADTSEIPLPSLKVAPKMGETLKCTVAMPVAGVRELPALRRVFQVKPDALCAVSIAPISCSSTDGEPKSAEISGHSERDCRSGKFDGPRILSNIRANEGATSKAAKRPTRLKHRSTGQFTIDRGSGGTEQRTASDRAQHVSGIPAGTSKATERDGQSNRTANNDDITSTNVEPMNMAATGAGNITASGGVLAEIFGPPLRSDFVEALLAVCQSEAGSMILERIFV